GENTQRGRYREFTQCDFDNVGCDNAAADFEILFMMHKALCAAGAESATVHINHRAVFNRFLKRLNAEKESAQVLRIVDKLAKIGSQEVLAQLSAILNESRANDICEFVQTKGNWDETLSAMEHAAGGSDSDTERLKQIRIFMKDTGVQDKYVLDPSITRGLDYYTGIVFETFLDDVSGIGSVCSGGRYGNLMGLYSKEVLSGVGSSVGLDRLIAALESSGKIKENKTYAKLIIVCTDEARFGLYQALADKIRGLNIPAEVLCEAKKLTAQFVEAEKKGAQWVLIPSQDDPVNGAFTLRNLATRQNKENILFKDLECTMTA
ncbi:MAG: histidine--tRNA ligase family protein, partial [Spirochaetaceae bacterium]|nr:histidine--tRNA ligase family protein [Spirochaetaceae bacterium]